MNAVEELIVEHKAVSLTLRILEKITQKAAATRSLPNREHLEQLFEFFQVFVDRCHHGKEEELLFPALEQVGVSRNGGPIGVMLSEHDQGRELVRRMKAALIADGDGQLNAVEQFIKVAGDFIRLLNQHIEKENHILFPIAQKHLPDSALAELKKGFDRIEVTKIGPGKHEAFHAMIEELEMIYLYEERISA